MVKWLCPLVLLLAFMTLATACVPMPPATPGEVEAKAPMDVPAVQQTTTIVETHPSQGDVVQIEGSKATLFTTDDSATMTFRTSKLEPGYVYTAWWVVINNPVACATSPCTPKDVLGNTEAVEADVTRADGIVVGDDGVGTFAGYLAKGTVPGGWFGHGFTNPRGAEIHIVINDHGLLIPELAANMLNSYRGGCTDESLPPAFPDTAKADGVPGPNTCRLVQISIFRQQ